MTTVKTASVQSMIAAFESAVKRAETPAGELHLAQLRTDVRSVVEPDLAQAFENSIDLLEERFAKTKTVGCGMKMQVLPSTLSPSQVKSVFAALLEAKTRGVTAIDANKDGRISTDEAAHAKDRTLGQRLAGAAAEAATGIDSGGGPSTRVGC